jgi:hypothetical protein
MLNHIYPQMKILRSIQLIMILILSSTFYNGALKAQNRVKPQFKNLTYSSYEIIGSGDNKKVNILDLIEINGYSVHITTKCYKGVSDTTYILSDSMIEGLNTVFNGKRKLKSFIKIYSLSSGHYAGPLDFTSYTDQNGITDNLIVVQPFMDETFSKVLDIIRRFPASYSNVKYTGDGVRNTETEKTILKYHNSCKYLPAVESPPPTMN